MKKKEKENTAAILKAVDEQRWRYYEGWKIACRHRERMLVRNELDNYLVAVADEEDLYENLRACQDEYLGLLELDRNQTELNLNLAPEPES